MRLIKSHLNITLDGQFGSTGKGLFNDFIAKQEENQVDIAISNAAPNAGHTFVDEHGIKKTVFHLPVSGVLQPNSQIYMCAGSIIDPDLLAQEISDFGIDPARVAIHPRACILLPEHKEREALNDSGATAIASTRKGVGAALADKIARIAGPRTALQYYGEGSMVKELDLLKEMGSGRKTCLMEVPQGFGLSLNYGRSYPQCTSRDLTVAQALNDAGVHPIYLGAVGLCLRSYPIRVGNIVEEGKEIGNSGPFFPDSDEKTWEDMGQTPELTTVTKRVRRIATFSYLQYKQALQTLRPNTVFLNFCNYFQSVHDFKECIVRMSNVEERVGLNPHKLFGFGPAASDIISNPANLQVLWDKLEQSRG